MTNSNARFTYLWDIAFIIIIIVLFKMVLNISSSSTLAYAQPLDESTTVAKLDFPFHLRINQTAIIKTENVSIQFLDIVEDSRCPSDVRCIWAGQVTISVNITKYCDSPHRMNLTVGPLGSNSSIGELDNYKIQLLQVQPYPKASTGQINEADYVAVLKISDRKE